MKPLSNFKIDSTDDLINYFYDHNQSVFVSKKIRNTWLLNNKRFIFIKGLNWEVNFKDVGHGVFYAEKTLTSWRGPMEYENDNI